MIILKRRDFTTSRLIPEEGIRQSRSARGTLAYEVNVSRGGMRLVGEKSKHAGSSGAWMVLQPTTAEAVVNKGITTFVEAYEEVAAWRGDAAPPEWREWHSEVKGEILRRSGEKRRAGKCDS